MPHRVSTPLGFVARAPSWLGHPHGRCHRSLSSCSHHWAASSLFQQWLADQLSTIGFRRCRADSQFYFRPLDQATISVHADDLRYTASDSVLPELERQISGLVSIKWTGSMTNQWSRFLGSEWRRSGSCIFVRPSPVHIQAILEGLGLAKGNGVKSLQWSVQEERKVPTPLPADQAALYRRLV